MRSVSSPMLSFSGLEIRQHQRRVLRNGIDISLTRLESTKAGTLTVKWKKDTAASGYIIECSTDRKFRKNVKTITVKKNKTTSKKITKLKSGKKYYVRACAYAQAGGAKIKGAYTAGKKAVKVKR